MKKIKYLKSTLIIILLLVALGSTGFISFCIYARHFLDSELLLKRNPSAREGTLRIALIGDSWIAGEKLDQPIIDEMSKLGWTIQLSSFGHPGARTKRIYQNLFKEKDDDYSSYPVLFSDDPYDLVVILAGVNDSAGYMGADFYTHHMSLIIEALLRRGSVPVIIELPEYGIEDAESTNPVGFVRRRLFKTIYNEGIADVIPVYRNELKKWLQEHKKENEYIFVGFEKVSSDYSENLGIYANPLHLNEAGNRLLSKSISLEMNKWLTNRSTLR